MATSLLQKLGVTQQNKKKLRGGIRAQKIKNKNLAPAANAETSIAGESIEDGMMSYVDSRKALHVMTLGPLLLKNYWGARATVCLRKT
jgi:hypothetical protein